MIFDNACGQMKKRRRKKKTKNSVVFWQKMLSKVIKGGIEKNVILI